MLSRLWGSYCHVCMCVRAHMSVRARVCASHIIVKLILHSCQPEGGQAKLSCVLQLTFMAFLSFSFLFSLFARLQPDWGILLPLVLKANQSLSRNPMSWHFIFAAPHNKSCRYTQREYLYTDSIRNILYV